MPKPLQAEDALWKIADKLRGRMNPTEYRPLVLGLVFLKAMSERGAEAEADGLRLPLDVHWETVRKGSRDELGGRIDAAMAAINAANPGLQGAAPTGYARAGLSPVVLGELLDLLSEIVVTAAGTSRTDVLGRIYEYFLGRFAATAGRGDGEFYTPPSVVEVLVEVLRPFSGNVYDPCNGSGGMFVQVERFVEAHGESRGGLKIIGQEMNPSTWKLAHLNLAAHGLSGDLGEQPADTFEQDLHPKLKADFVLANPPFNISDWGQSRLRRDGRWRWGLPPATNANYAWLEHIASKLATGGAAGVVLANGSLSSNQAEEKAIRTALVEADLIECIVALPGKLFFTTGIPACLWFLRNGRAGDESHGDRRGEVLFIDARELGTMVTRIHRELTADDVASIADTYHRWRGVEGLSRDVPGFAAARSTLEIAHQGFTLVPARYVGTAEDDVETLNLAELEAKLVDELRTNAALATQISSHLMPL